MEGLQRGSAAIVGVAESDLGAVAGDMSPIDLMAQGIHRALADCGLGLRDVDGLVCATAQSRTSGLALAEYLGISPAFVDTTILGGSSFMFHVAHAQAALQLGLCKVAVIAYGSTQRTIGRRHASVREYNPYETPFRPFLPSTAYALAASRHMHQYGTTREQLAAVAVAAREWALLNPVAWEKKPLTIAEVLSARMISYPFTVRDCCLVTDGGGAVIMTTAERSQSLKKLPVYVLGCVQAITHANISSMPDLTVGSRFLPEGGGRLFCRGRAYCPKRQPAGQHQWRWAFLLPPRDVRSVSADRGDAAAAPRMRRAPSRRLRNRDRARQWRRVVVAEHGDFGDGGYGIRIHHRGTETAEVIANKRLIVIPAKAGIHRGNGSRLSPGRQEHDLRVLCVSVVNLYLEGDATWPKAHWFVLKTLTGSVSSLSTTRRSTRSRPACPRASSRMSSAAMPIPRSRRWC